MLRFFFLDTKNQLIVMIITRFFIYSKDFNVIDFEIVYDRVLEKSPKLVEKFLAAFQIVLAHI